MSRREGYAPEWADDVVALMSTRTAESHARFLLPSLTAGMRVLDVGCGPGTITLGLAQFVAPAGAAVGIDLEASQVELARAEAQRVGLANVDFQVGSAYELAFADESFDVVLAHALIEHLAHPRDAFAEIRRVLRVGGVIGVCSSDWSGAVVEPRTVDVNAALECHFELRRRAGGDPFAGGRLPAVVEAAGFVEARTIVEQRVDLPYGDLARYVGHRIEAAALDAATSDRADLTAGVSAVKRWAEHKDGRFTQRWVAVVAQRP